MPAASDSALAPPRRRLVPCAVALAFLLPCRAASRTPDDAPPRVRASVDVTVLDLDVVATKGGRPVTDLRKEEIVVKVDGKVLPVDLFARVEGARVVSPAPGPPRGPVGVSVPELPSSAGPGTVVPRQFLIYFDDARLLPSQRPPVIEGLRGFLVRLGPSDEASVVSYNGATNVLVPFTSSQEDLLEGLARLERILPRGFAREREFRAAVAAAEQEARLQATRGRGGAPSDLRDSIVRRYSEEERVRSRAGLQELRRTISALAGRPGRRRMLLVTTGWESVPGQTLAQMTWGRTTLRQFDTTLRRELDALLVAANRSGVTVDVVDAMGFEGELDPEQRELRDVGAWVAMENRRPAMTTLAEATGGTFIERSNSFAVGLEELWRDASDWYSVGVTLPEALPEGKVARVSLSCTRPGVTLRTRTGVGAIDEAGGRSEVAPERHDVSVPAARLAEVAGREVPLSGLLRTRPGRHRVVVTVRDVASGRTAVASAPLFDE